MYKNASSKLDLPVVYSRYNAGGNSNTNDSLWLLPFYGYDYPLFTSKYYNSVKNNTAINLKSSFYKSI